MARSRYTVTKYLNDDKTHSAVNNKLFKRLNFITDQLYQVEIVKSEVEHREPIIVRFFILQSAKLRMLELFYKFPKKFCNTEKYEELETDTESLYLDLSEENLKILISQRKKTNGNQYVSQIVQIASLRTQQATSSQEQIVLLIRSMIRGSRDCSKKNSAVPKCCVCVPKPFVAKIERLTSITSVARDSIKELWKTVKMDPCHSMVEC